MFHSYTEFFILFSINTESNSVCIHCILYCEQGAQERIQSAHLLFSEDSKDDLIAEIHSSYLTEVDLLLK